MSASVVIIGNFDGVHRGHQAVLRQARVRAAEEDQRRPGGTSVVALTFDPHPAEVLGRGAPPRLATLERRGVLLRAGGADLVHVEPFTRAFAATSPADFARGLLAARLEAVAVVVGENFRFGSKRAGDFAALRALGAELGFEAVAAEVAGDDAGPFSSTRVRDAIAAGEVERAAEVLGRPHRITGIVEHGDRRGRTIGFPTANLGAIAEILPAFGVYAVRVSRAGSGGEDGASLATGVMNVGVRPTVDGSSLRVEAHLFDIDEDLYGASLAIDVVARLRGERRFDSLSELTAQIARDAAAARDLLGGRGPAPA